MGHPASTGTVAELLRYLDYSLHGTSKQVEGTQRADRDAQFRYIHDQAQAFGAPVISVDAKKLMGHHSNAGVEWHPGGEPPRVDVHDFPDPEIPKAIPSGVYDLAANNAWVSVGDDHDTAAFAAATVRRWWTTMGARAYTPPACSSPPMPAAPTATATRCA